MARAQSPGPGFHMPPRRRGPPCIFLPIPGSQEGTSRRRSSIHTTSPITLAPFQLGQQGPQQGLQPKPASLLPCPVAALGLSWPHRRLAKHLCSLPHLCQLEPSSSSLWSNAKNVCALLIRGNTGPVNGRGPQLTIWSGTDWAQATTHWVPSSREWDLPVLPIPHAS